MPEQASFIDLGRFALSSGEGERIETDVRIEGFELSGEPYGVEGGGAPARIDASRMTTGYALRLRFQADVVGPCMRCLEPSSNTVEVDTREVDQPGGGEELQSPYLSGDKLDVASWARDALVLALPARLVCGEDCPGLKFIDGTAD